MKKVFEKIVMILEYIIGLLLAVCLFGGGIGFFGFVIAFCVGGESAVAICTWLSGTYYAGLIRVSTITTFLTFALMYLNGTAKWVNPFHPWKLKKK